MLAASILLGCGGGGGTDAPSSVKVDMSTQEYLIDNTPVFTHAESVILPKTHNYCGVDESSQIRVDIDLYFTGEYRLRTYSFNDNTQEFEKTPSFEHFFDPEVTCKDQLVDPLSGERSGFITPFVVLVV